MKQSRYGGVRARGGRFFFFAPIGAALALAACGSVLLDPPLPKETEPSPASAASSSSGASSGGGGTTASSGLGSPAASGGNGVSTSASSTGTGGDGGATCGIPAGVATGTAKKIRHPTAPGY